MITNHLANMLTCIRNANLIQQPFTFIRYNKLNYQIIKILITEKYLKKFEYIYVKNIIFYLKIYFNYDKWFTKNLCFTKLIQISKSSKRIYSNYKEFFKLLKNFNQGIGIISTSNGIMTHYKAIQLKKGGEVLCYIE